MDDTHSSPDIPRPREEEREFIPARMINEFVYCPRLACLEWLQGEFEDSADTVAGRHDHRRVDVSGPLLPDPEDIPEGDQPVLHARSVLLSTSDPGIIARIDLVEAEGRLATPVDYKHGRKPDLPEGVWDADLVQIGAQALVLRANGYQCDRAVVFYVGSRERVEVPITGDLTVRVLDACAGLRAMAASGCVPPPLHDSPKCGGCSLAGICLPDETEFLSAAGEVPDEDAIRHLYPILPDALPVYDQDQGAFVGKSGECVVVRLGKQVMAEVPMLKMNQLAVFGRVQVTTQAIQELFRRGIPVCYLSLGGYFYGLTAGFGSRNVELRRAQFRMAEDPTRCLRLARRIVSAKVRNQRTVLRRNSPTVPDQDLRQMEELGESAAAATAVDSLLGVEGMAARIYYGHFASLLKPRDEAGRMTFDFEGRNRRPPRDPVNAMLSLCYSLLAKDCGVTVTAVGFDPHLGFFHTPHHGRQAMALDLMEEFRPILADSTVITVVNNGEVKAGDFVRAARSVALKPEARKRLIEAYERRLDQAITHPVFGYRVSYRKTLEVQARLLGRYVTGEIAEFPAILPR